MSMMMMMMIIIITIHVAYWPQWDLGCRLLASQCLKLQIAVASPDPQARCVHNLSDVVTFAAAPLVSTPVVRNQTPEPARREFPGKFESSNLSRHDLSREVGRS